MKYTDLSIQGRQVEGVLAVTVGVIETDTFVVTVGTETAFWTFRESEWAAL